MSAAPQPGGPHDAPSDDPRGRILGRVRAALAGREVLPHPGRLERAGGAGTATRGPGEGERGLDGPRALGDRDEVAEAFARSFAASGGETVRLRSVAQARDWLAGFSGEFRSAAVSPDVPMDLRPELPQAEPASAELGVSLAVGAASATGSLLLSSRHGRALQLLPPVHLVWVDVDGIREGLEQALRVARSRGPLPAVLALHSGPSKSADIGRIVVTGVHGPGRVVAALLTRSGGEESILSRVGLP